MFVESKHILTKKISEDNDFIGLNLVIATDGEETAYTITLYF